MSKHYIYQTDDEWWEASPVPWSAAKLFPGFKEWSWSASYSTEFRRTKPVRVTERRGIDLSTLDISGELAPKAFPWDAFNIAVQHFDRLASFQFFTLNAHFSRKGCNQTRQYPSALMLHSYDRRIVGELTYRGGDGETICPAGWEIAGLLSEAGFPVKVEDGQLRHTEEGRKCKITNFAIRFDLESIGHRQISQMAAVLEKMRDRIYGYSWDIGTVDEKRAERCGFAIIDAVQDAGLYADRYTLSAGYRFKNPQGWDVIRQFCGERERFSTPIGSYLDNKTKITLCVTTSATGHRLTLHSLHPLTENQFEKAGSVLGTQFQREPFKSPGKHGKK